MKKGGKAEKLKREIGKGKELRTKGGHRFKVEIDEKDRFAIEAPGGKKMYIPADMIDRFAEQMEKPMAVLEKIAPPTSADFKQRFRDTKKQRRLHKEERV